jgi:hypothetical protein
MSAATAKDQEAKYESLRARFCEQPERYPEPYRVRIHRALSWLKRSARAGRR